MNNNNRNPLIRIKEPYSIEFITQLSQLCKLSLFNVIDEKATYEAKLLLNRLDSDKINAMLHTNDRLIIDLGFVLHEGIKYGVFNKGKLEESFRKGLKRLNNRELTKKNKLELELLVTIFSKGRIYSGGAPFYLTGFCHREHFYNYFVYLFNKFYMGSKVRVRTDEIKAYVITTIKEGYYYESLCFTALLDTKNSAVKHNYLLPEDIVYSELSFQDSLALSLLGGDQYR